MAGVEPATTRVSSDNLNLSDSTVPHHLSFCIKKSGRMARRDIPPLLVETCSAIELLSRSGDHGVGQAGLEPATLRVKSITRSQRPAYLTIRLLICLKISADE